ncbi:MAG: VWA domain-containing protein [Planctomycetes bacterium]|nr:VWA domain-containing protein [Planctomycetota bacterium]
MIRLEHPGLLIAALPVALSILILLRRGRRSDASIRRAVSLAVRAILLTFLALALSGPSHVRTLFRPSDVVFALDVSDSVSDPALEKAVSAVESASRDVSARGGWSALLLFAGRAAAARPPAPEPIVFTEDLRTHVFGRRAEAQARSAAERGIPSPSDLGALAGQRQALDPLQTKVSSAILLAKTFYRAGADSRTIVLTDGYDSDPAKNPAAGEDVMLVRLPDLPVLDVAVRGIRIPLAVRAGEPFDADIEIHSTAARDISLWVTIDDLSSSEITTRSAVPPGKTSLRIRNIQSVHPLSHGLHRVRAVVSAEGDEEPRNNWASAALAVVGKSRLLLVEGSPGDAEGLSRILTAQGIEFELASLTRISSWDSEWDAWAAIALVGVAPSRVPESAVDALTRYLENGGGLLFAGPARPPERSSNGEAFARLLPVELLPPAAPRGGTDEPSQADPPPARPKNPRSEPRRVLAPSIALLLVIDKSGSMAGDNITICKEAAIGAAETLSDKDFIGLLAFDSKSEWVLEFTEAHRADLIRSRVLRLFADGGTDVYRAMLEAQRAFREDPRARSAGIRHLVLLSDGKTRPDNFEKTVREMAEDGVVVSTVCVVSPDGFEDRLMRKIAEWGGGRAFFANSFNDVPKIFTDEVNFIVRKARRDVEEKAPADAPPVPAEPEPRTPDRAPKPAAHAESIEVRFKDEHEVLRGIPRAAPPPPLKGLMPAKPRPTSYVPLASADDAPVLALWRFGLGRSAAWLSDIGGSGTARWSDWQATPKLFAQVVRHLFNAVEDVDLAAGVRAERRGAGVDFWIDPGIALHQVAPGRRPLEAVPQFDGTRHAFLPWSEPGVAHRVSITRTRGDVMESLPAEFVLPYAREIACPPDRPPPFSNWPAAPFALDELASALPVRSRPESARVDLAGWCILLALALLPVDVAVRRVR